MDKCNIYKVLLVNILLIIAQPIAAGSLYTELGEDKGINRFVTKADELSHADKRIAFLFEDTDDEELILQISDQICFLSKSPCEYEGLDMEEAHSRMEITEAEFDTFVEIVIDAMEFANIPHTARNKLLALLAPMREDIIYQ